MLFRSSPKRREHTPFYDEFEFFETWMNNYPNKSFMSAMLYVACKKKKMQWWEILNDSNLWVSKRIKQAVSYLLSQRELIETYGLRINSTEFDDLTHVDFNEIEKFRMKSSVEAKIDVKN